MAHHACYLSQIAKLEAADKEGKGAAQARESHAVLAARMQHLAEHTKRQA
jgi:hypothetical protein